MVAAIGGRLVGVRIPESQDREMSDLPANTVVQLVEMRVCGVGIVSENGEIISTVAYKVGREWWTDPNGEAWMKDLLRAGPKLSEALEDLYAAQAGVAPDAVMQTGVKVNLAARRIDKQAKSIADSK